eukprot:g35314.t1
MGEIPGHLCGQRTLEPGPPRYLALGYMLVKVCVAPGFVIFLYSCKPPPPTEVTGNTSRGSPTLPVIQLGQLRVNHIVYGSGVTCRPDQHVSCVALSEIAGACSAAQFDMAANGSSTMTTHPSPLPGPVSMPHSGCKELPPTT